MTEIDATKLINNGYTCVIYNDTKVIKSTRRGVAPLLELFDSGDEFSSFSAVDKVVGRAAAFLYLALKIKNVYAITISAPALKLLEQHGVAVKYDILCDRIVNRKGDGLCPMENTVMDVHDSEAAVRKIRMKLKELNTK